MKLIDKLRRTSYESEEQKRRPTDRPLRFKLLISHESVEICFTSDKKNYIVVLCFFKGSKVSGAFRGRITNTQLLSQKKL